MAGLSKTFQRASGTPVRAIADLTLEVAGGEFLVLLGPSGCGKTTLLRAVAGLERPDAGEIHTRRGCLFSSAAGIEVLPERRRIGMVFQSYALWPHMTVYENVAFPLRSQGVARSKIAPRVTPLLEALGLGELAESDPGRISGGQQQRVALARALVAGEELVLFDEPLSNVDARVRQQLRAEILQRQRDLGFTAMYVTHDQEEALGLATTVAVMRAGTIEQLAAPRDVYFHPRTRYVATFVGSANFIPATIRAVDAGNLIVDTPLGQIVSGGSDDGDWHPGQEIELVSRPESWLVDSAANVDIPSQRWSAEVVSSMFLGPRTECEMRIGDVTLTVAEPGPRAWARGDRVNLRCDSFWALPADPAGA